MYFLHKFSSPICSVMTNTNRPKYVSFWHPPAMQMMASHLKPHRLWRGAKQEADCTQIISGRVDSHYDLELKYYWIKWSESRWIHLSKPFVFLFMFYFITISSLLWTFLHKNKVWLIWIFKTQKKIVQDSGFENSQFFLKFYAA